MLSREKTSALAKYNFMKSTRGQSVDLEAKVHFSSLK